MKRGFYALVRIDDGYVSGIHYFNGETFTEKIERAVWKRYRPACRTPNEFNRQWDFFKMEYLGE